MDQLPLYDVLAGSYTIMSNNYIELSGVDSISTLWEAIVVAVKDYSDSTGRSTLLLYPHSIKNITINIFFALEFHLLMKRLIHNSFNDNGDYYE